MIAYGLRGRAYMSADAGRSWQKIDTSVPAALTAGASLLDGSVVMVNQAGQVLRSTDQGRSFSPIPVSQPSSFTGVAQSADGSLVLSGIRGITRTKPVDGVDEAGK